MNSEYIQKVEFKGLEGPIGPQGPEGPRVHNLPMGLRVANKQRTITAGPCGTENHNFTAPVKDGFGMRSVCTKCGQSRYY